MHIKQITISNFRSFKQQPEIHPFASTTNCVVGRNGSGKSNLFDAIQFVLLAPRFATLRSEERQALLHEGSGSAAVNAFVEVVFDNSDHRFSLENSDEVVLRRTVGSKKDEFFLQRKRATKQEVQSLLEGAGFSKSNPYFMVQQGKIQTLCTMTDAQRLQLLQQVAGTTLYEDKKSESLAKMQENFGNIEKIHEILAELDQKLSDLQGEKEELVNYQQCDRQRKALEYTLYDKELRKARQVLDHLEHERTEHAQELTRLHETAKTTHDAIQTAEHKLRLKTAALQRSKGQESHWEADKTRAVTTKTKLRLECQELQDQVQQGTETLESNKRELQLLERQIATARQQLAEKDALWTSASQRLSQIQMERDSAQRQMDSIYAKQGRGQKYATKQERDKVLRRQIQDLESLRQEKEAYLVQQRDTLGNLRRTIGSNEQELEAKREEISSKSGSLQSIGKALDEKQKNRLILHETRKQTWRKAEELQEKARETREAMHKAISDTRKSMPRATAMGLKALRNIVEQERMVVGEQYFGMLMENMTVKDPKYQTAIEVAAQNSLFHVIVDSDATAARLMKRLEEGRLGRVTFLPLNRLQQTHPTNYPQSPDVTPLLDVCIDYDPKVARAMQHVFDKKMLARTPEVASEWSSRVHMDCITLDGDLCSRKGALTGGYVDATKSRLRAFSQQREAQDTYALVEREFHQADSEAKIAEQEVTNSTQELTRLQHKQAQMRRLTQSLESNLEQLQVQLDLDKKHAQKIEMQTIPPLEREIEAAKGDMARLQEEIGTELTSTVTEEDRANLSLLKQQHVELNNNLQAQQDVVEEIGAERQKLHSILEDNLLKRRQELTEVRDESGGPTTSTVLQEQRIRDLEERRQQLAEATSVAEDIEQRLEEARRVEEELKAELIAAKNELEKLKSQDMKTTKLLEEASERSEKLMSKKSMNISKRETYMRKIQELGSLPPPAELENYKNVSIPDLMKNLERVNKKLKKYSHVNKKAFDQYVNFSEQRESLLNRKEELDRGAEKVKELVENLDRKKDEAINRTFRGVSKHFKEVFQELVPLGAGELIMRTALDDGVEGEGTDEEMESEDGSPAKKKKFDPNNPDVSLYKGVGIKVRFSAVGENFIMSQLSGGQKALVALALIFAIQRCDPAPFYIFDELDQALDSSYRQAVANVILRQANSPDTPTQFICSTFRPELVAVSKNCYGISHQNKVSSFHHMSKNDALKFIANLMSEEEAVGEVATVGTGKSSKRKRKSVEGGNGGKEVTEEDAAVLAGEGAPADGPADTAAAEMVAA